MMDQEAMLRNYFEAYETKNRDLIESLLSTDFHFTSPYDDCINRREYFKRCWPGSEQFKHVDILSVAINGVEAFVRYEIELEDGTIFKNTDAFTFKEDGLINSQEAYFGDPPKGMSRSQFANLSQTT